MTRLMAGRAWKPVLAPHQSSRRSKIFWPGVELTSFQGPVVTGEPLLMSKFVKVVGSCPLNTCSGTIGKPASWCHWKNVNMNRGAGMLKVILAVRGSGPVTSLIQSFMSEEKTSFGALSFIVVSVKTTSLLVKG